MKIKKGFILKEVSNQIIVVPVGEAAIKFHGMITLNETGKFLFENLKDDISLEDLTLRLIENYDVDPKRAYKDCEMFIELLDKHHILDK
ncbi:PqqD family protein [Acholeplasma granularum]|uniref:PqqD family protein n=1 Tax=Acholeplasma granularum TaxID=264635 RepID=UPI000471A046|nr:PqqD family protein [Acholeplasma granularum]